MYRLILCAVEVRGLVDFRSYNKGSYEPIGVVDLHYSYYNYYYAVKFNYWWEH